MKIATVIQVSILVLLLVSAVVSQQRRPRQGLQRPRPLAVGAPRRVPARKPGGQRFGRGGPSGRRRPPGVAFKPPPPDTPSVPGPDLVVPASGAPSEALRAGLDGVRNFQHLLTDQPPPPTPAPRPHSTTRPPLTREQAAMLQELQTILGTKPLPLDKSASAAAAGNGRRPDADRQLPLFPPFGNGVVNEADEDDEELPGEGVVSGALFQDFSPSRLFSPPDSPTSALRRQFVRFADEGDDLASGVIEPGSVRFPATVAPPIVTPRPTTAPSLRILGGLRPLLAEGAENSERNARVIQSVDDNGQLITNVFSTSTRATLDRAVTPPSFAADFASFGFGRAPPSAKPESRPGPALTTGLRLHQVLTSTARPTPPPAVTATTYNPNGLRAAVLSALSGDQVLSPSGQVRDLGRDPPPPAGSGGSRQTLDAEELVRRSVMPQDLEKLCKSTAENGICDTEEQYPRAYMERVVDQCSTILEYLYSEVPDDLSQLHASDRQTPTGGSGGTGSRQWSWAAYNYRHEDACDATSRFVEPSYAQATDGRWYVIVQHHTLRQRASVGVCQQLEGSCRAVADCGTRSRCVQTYYHRTLIAADPRLPTKCPRMKTFRLPAGCHCQVELAKSLRTLDQATTGNES